MYLIYLIAPLLFLWSRRFAPLFVYWSSASAPYMVEWNVRNAPIDVYWSGGFAPRNFYWSGRFAPCTPVFLNLNWFGVPLSGNFSIFDLSLLGLDKLLIFDRQVP